MNSITLTRKYKTIYSGKRSFIIDSLVANDKSYLSFKDKRSYNKLIRRLSNDYISIHELSFKQYELSKFIFENMVFV